MSERELSPTEALFNIMSTLHTLGLSAVTRYTTPSKLVATAELFDDNDNLVESGAGKGPDSLIGALAESIEHFSTFQPLTDAPIRYRSDKIATQKAVAEDGIFTSLPLTENLIECFRLTSLNDTEELFAPCILLCPETTQNIHEDSNSALRFLSRYSSNSGIAFGCTENEALLHGIHETIERHILSLFYMAVCGLGPAIELYTPSTALLETALTSHPAALTSADRLQVIIIKDVLSVYFAVAFPKAGPGAHHLSPIGSGCSLEIHTAIQRAVTEQFQSEDLYGAAEESIDRETFDLLSKSRHLKNLIDFAPIIKTTLPIINAPAHIDPMTVSAQLEELQKNLSIKKMKIFHRTVARFSNNSIVTQIYIPGLERFNIIRNGRLVVPQHVLRG
ncbi:YcaO-like family protein [Pseudomonas sp. SAICEU22]|uniref:YcaO-like family protein n=1 Tax=Pseudomonas agronomica TaxID=2979328 RepID=A0ABT3F502_9PSED|nr:YcaO-like family protein [Pseudomonas agronomica]MCW1244143.1 YcaO-like family protein [Pseudomonas agronomica]